MKVYTPLEGEPFSIEEIREFLKVETELAAVVLSKNAKLEELKNAIAQKRVENWILKYEFWMVSMDLRNVIPLIPKTEFWIEIWNKS